VTGGLIRGIVTLAVVAAILVPYALWTAAQHKGPPRESVNGAVRKLSARHRGEPGMIIDVLWPLTYLYAWRRTVSTVVIFDKTFLGEVVRFTRHINSRRRAVWVPLKGGGKRRLRCVAGGDVDSTTYLEIDVHHNGHVLVTCWPAKRRLITPARSRTEWAVDPID
jgi:hypothetical protein